MNTTRHTRHRLLAAAGIAAALLGAGVITQPVSANPVPVSAVATTVAVDRTVGETTTGNLGVGGQCTYGAYEKFHEATGLWPVFAGNAADWNDTAPAHGWTVVLDAEPRAVVVFEPGVQGADPTFGHVAWVDAVTPQADGTRLVSITEMNAAAGEWGWSQRTITDVVGMSYVLAP
jgi:surface antigen